ncbi:MAG: hypothetical protein BMS9Abin02_1456 [Anaerolineae bacterium]|nr:MAG: hypothetical protein BMS9Abin02_1456 [Anaerolineae bacterium]
MPNILDFLDFFSFLQGTLGVIVVLTTAATIFVVRDWRLSLISLAIQYLVVGLLFAEVLLPHLAFMKVIVGLFITLILYITARQVNWGSLPIDVSPEEAVQLKQERLIRLGPYMLPTDAPFRLFLGLTIALIVFAVSQRALLQLPVVSSDFGSAIIGLVAYGLVGMSLTTEPLKAGLGLLTFMTGFELFYSSLEQSVAMLVMLAVTNLILALAISYLVQARHAYRQLLD